MSTLKLEHIANINNAGPDISIDASGHLNIVNGNLQMGGVTMLDASSGDFNTGNNASFNVLDVGGEVSGRIRNWSSPTNSIAIESDPLNTAAGSYLTFTVDGDRKATIESTGAFNIGTTGTSGGGKLRVEGLIDITTTSGGSAFRIYDGTTFRGGLGDGAWTGTGDAGDFGLYVGSTAKKIPIHIGSSTPIAAFTSIGLGIGTSAPSTTNSGYNGGTLHVHNTSTGSSIRLTNSTTGTGASSGMLISKWNDSKTYFTNFDDGAQTVFTQSDSGGNLVTALTLDGDGNISVNNGILYLNNALNLNATASSVPSNGGIARLSNGYTYFSGKSDGNGAVLSNGAGTATVRALSPTNGYIDFETGAGNHRMRITSNGNLSLGNSTPITTSRLVVEAPSNEPVATFYRPRNTGGGGLVNFLSDVGSTNSEVGAVYSEGSSAWGNYTSDLEMTFKTGQNGTTRLRFNDLNSTEGSFIKAQGIGGGGKIHFGPRWNDDEDAITFHMLRSGYGYGFNGAKIGIGTTSPGSTIHAIGANPTITLQGNGSGYTEGCVLLLSPNDYRGGGVYMYNDNGTSTDNEWFSGRVYAGAANYHLCFKSNPGNPGQDTAQGTYAKMIVYQNGNYYFAGSNVSDRRSKQDIEIETTQLDNVLALQPKTFRFKAPLDENGEPASEPSDIRHGLIAQEVLEVMPNLVTGDETQENQRMGVDYNGLTSVLVKAIQEQQAIIEDLKARIQVLEGQ